LSIEASASGAKAEAGLLEEAAAGGKQIRSKRDDGTWVKGGE
jgi:hypothetical protein